MYKLVEKTIDTYISFIPDKKHPKLHYPPKDTTMFVVSSKQPISEEVLSKELFVDGNGVFYFLDKVDSYYQAYFGSLYTKTDKSITLYDIKLRG